MKRIIIMFMIVMMATTVMGIDAGDIVTQQQLDSIDWETINIQCQLEDIGDNHIYTFNNVKIYARIVSCLTIDLQEDGDYLITRKKHYPLFEVKDYLGCRETETRAFCSDIYSEYLVTQHQQAVTQIRRNIRNYQTQSGTNDFDDLFGL